MTTANVLPSVASAIDDIKSEFLEAVITIAPDGQGGARVCLDGVQLRSPRFQGVTWIGFYITFVYPNADIYPHYVRPDLIINGSAAAPLHPNHEFMGRSAIMVSRVNRSHDPSTDTALLKLHKVIEWLNDQR
jgi:hypothetical protein